LMRRFFFEYSDRNGEIVFLSEEESYHLVKVLRLSKGTTVELLDGSGAVYSAIVMATGRRVELHIEAIVSKDDGKEQIIWVGQSVLKGDKMDTVVQKCTELGVTRMTPLRSSRCQGKLNAKQSLKKHERWQRISLAACKQCLRSRQMQLDMPVSYTEWLGEVSGCAESVRLLFWEEEKKVRLQDIPPVSNNQPVVLLLGPEGGFSMEEVEQAREMGWITVSLGKRILRAETATLTAVSIIQYLTGNL